MDSKWQPAYIDGKPNYPPEEAYIIEGEWDTDPPDRFAELATEPRRIGMRQVSRWRVVEWKPGHDPLPENVSALAALAYLEAHAGEPLEVVVGLCCPCTLRVNSGELVRKCGDTWHKAYLYADLFIGTTATVRRYEP